jgi:hypothetical protein
VLVYDVQLSEGLLGQGVLPSVRGYGRSRSHIERRESAPCTRIRMTRTMRKIRSASVHFPCQMRDQPRLYAAWSRALLSCSASRSRDHNSSASPVRIAHLH